MDEVSDLCVMFERENQQLLPACFYMPSKGLSQNACSYTHAASEPRVVYDGPPKAPQEPPRTLERPKSSKVMTHELQVGAIKLSRRRGEVKIMCTTSVLNFKSHDA